jgi:predicted AlkP superfamily pyrophosphatase or phosphodiesterase
MPYLSSLHDSNSLTLRAAVPSITPVNFATMVTGTAVDGHEVRAREDDFACETLFDLVRAAGGKSAGVGLSGYTGSELMGRHADIRGDAGEGSDEAVAEMVIKIAEAHRPSLLIAQLGRVDDAFHEHGPSSPAVVPMLEETDARLRRLVERLKPLVYGILILADHGQHDVMDPAAGAVRGSHGTDSAEDRLVPCTWL